METNLAQNKLTTPGMRDQYTASGPSLLSAVRILPEHSSLCESRADHKTVQTRQSKARGSKDSERMERGDSKGKVRKGDSRGALSRLGLQFE